MPSAPCRPTVAPSPAAARRRLRDHGHPPARLSRATCSSSSTPLIAEYGARIEVAVSDQEIPYPYVLERADELAGGGVTAAELARHFPTPQLSAVGDEIADGQWELSRRRAAPALAVRCRPRRLFAAPARALHGQRLAPRAAVDPAHQLSPLRRPVRALGARAARQRRRFRAAWCCPAMSQIEREHSPDEADALVAGCALAPLPDAGLSPGRAATARASPSSTSASARPTPRTSPTTWRCCARTAG